MKNVLAIAIVFAATSAFAAPLSGSLTTLALGVAATDPTTFAPVAADFYAVTVDNPNAADATSITLSLPHTAAAIGLQTRDGAAVPPTGGPFTFADSFFVSPTGTATDLLGVAQTDSAVLLEGSYTIAGGGVFVLAGGSADLAVLAVPAGTPVDPLALSGEAAVGGVLEPINFIPEPSTALLAGLALVGFVARRK